MDNDLKNVYFDGENVGSSVGWGTAFVGQLTDDIQVCLGILVLGSV